MAIDEDKFTHFVYANHYVYQESGPIIVDTNEIIVLDNIFVAAQTNFSIIIDNTGSPILEVNAYGSEDKEKYYDIVPGLYWSEGVPSNTVKYYEFQAMVRYLRITVIGTGVSTVKAYIHGLHY